MRGRHRTASHLVIGIVLAAFLATAPAEWLSFHAMAADVCTTDDDVHATTCRLQDGATLDGTLADDGASATYRVDALAPDGTLDLTLTAQSGSAHVAVLDWHGTILAEAVSGDPASVAQVQAPLALPGTYAVRVSGMAVSGNVTYRLTTKIGYTGVVPQAIWPTSLASGDGPLTGERQMLRTPRGGTPEGGVAVAKALRAPPEGEVDDFTLVADVRFEQILGPSALSLRFRYEPEAGGGTGYVLEIDPFGGTASLDRFEEGQRHPIVSKAPLPVVPTEQGPDRLIVQASGPSITVTLDGQPVLEVSDTHYPRGLIVVGAVTWSDPVAVTFDHIQVTGAPR